VALKKVARELLEKLQEHLAVWPRGLDRHCSIAQNRA
jgi:hypothetical protein